MIWEVFNQQGALLTFFGALGGAVRAAALKTSIFETARVIFVGSATSFSFGVLSPLILGPWIGEMSTQMGTSLGTLCAAAFVTGLVAVSYVERLIDKQKKGDFDASSR